MVRERALMALLVVIVTVSLGVTTLAGGPTSFPAAVATPPEPDFRPNIVVILTDDMRADEIELMPHVQRLLVRQGTSYSNAISPHPVCCPARAELITGQFGQNSGVRNNTGPWGGLQSLQDPHNTIGSWLKDSRYLTAYHGKYLNGYELVASSEEPGWTEWDAQVGGTYSYDQRARFADGDTIDGEYITHIISRRSNRTMSKFAARGRPFFTVINHIAPHGSHWRGYGVWKKPVYEERYRDTFQRLMPPAYDKQSFQEKDVRDLPRDLRRPAVDTKDLVKLTRHRARALLSVDLAVAKTVRKLRELGELDDTYIVFVSDNGYQLGEHRLRGKNLPFDESFDVPLVVRGPGVPAGAVIDEPVTLVDLVPTFLEWAGGLEAGRTLDGISLDQVVRDRPRDTLLVQIGDSTDDNTPGWRYRGVTTDRYLFAVQAGSRTKGILFDRELDPDALVNRFTDPDYAAIVSELFARTKELRDCAGVEECNRVFGALPEPG